MVTMESMPARPVYWCGEVDVCDVCGRKFLGTMYDASVPGVAWGNLCQRCFDDYGCSLGIGRGQRYDVQLDGRWLKVGG